MKELEHPIDPLYLLKKRRSLAKQLKSQSEGFQPLKVAILGGSTTYELTHILELFLLNLGFCPSFYQSEYNQFWNDVMFYNEALESFAPDLIYVHTCHRNIPQFPPPLSPQEEFDQLFHQTKEYFHSFWDKLQETFSCPILQNNLEHPPYRPLGNQDIVQGQTCFLQALNQDLTDYARAHPQFYVHDLQYLSAQVGLSRWHDEKAWHLYKYALSMEAIPHLAFSLSHIIASLYGKQKKAVVLDLDNTLWGGVVGDDGVENLKLGPETGEGETFLHLQAYLKSLQKRGILLSIASKNHYENAIAGLNHPDSLLKPEDFLSIQANWGSKDASVVTIAQELNLGLDSLVFVDDNPAERALVAQAHPQVAVPDQNSHFVQALSRGGYFEFTSYTQEDGNRQTMYQQNKSRLQLLHSTENHQDYLKSLEMVTEIGDFTPFQLERIAQLTNKTNQFNLTTKRYSKEALEDCWRKEAFLCLQGSLRDKFGDNGLVSVILGEIKGSSLVIDLWLMSCRVLQRGLEQAMLDVLVNQAKARGLSHLRGSYLPTGKNAMVKDLYKTMGFSLLQSLPEGESLWELWLEDYTPQSVAMTIREGSKQKRTNP